MGDTDGCRDPSRPPLWPLRPCPGPHDHELCNQDKFQHAGVPFKGRQSHWRQGALFISSKWIPAKAVSRVLFVVRDKELDSRGDVTPASTGLERLQHRVLGPVACLRCEDLRLQRSWVLSTPGDKTVDSEPRLSWLHVATQSSFSLECPTRLFPPCPSPLPSPCLTASLQSASRPESPCLSLKSL